MWCAGWGGGHGFGRIRGSDMLPSEPTDRRVTFRVESATIRLEREECGAVLKQNGSGDRR